MFPRKQFSGKVVLINNVKHDHIDHLKMFTEQGTSGPCPAPKTPGSRPAGTSPRIDFRESTRYFIIVVKHDHIGHLKVSPDSQDHLGHVQHQRH